MPRYNVEHENKWACFSSIVDDFITEFMPLDEYERWRKAEYGNETVDLSKANKMSYEEVLEIIKLRESE
jgi:hypothetical protein